MIYWITYSCFTCIEIICDLSMSWFPFFYEIKTIVLIWLLGQKGSMNLYKTLIHPVLIKKENVKINEVKSLENTKFDDEFDVFF